MDRSVSGRSVFGRCAWCVVWLGLLAAASGGCNVLAAIGYFTHQDNQPAECSEVKLKGQRVAIVCRPVLQLQYADSAAAPALAAAVGQLLSKNVKGIKIVSPSEVAEWADGHDWKNYPEIGRAVKADVVIGVDLEDFNLYKGQTLYQGSSDVHIWVYDMHNGGHRAWDKKVPPIIFPANSEIPTTEKSESEFRRQYLGVLAQHVARHFYSFDPMEDFLPRTDP